MKIGYLMQLGAEIRQPPYDGPANHVRHVVEALEKQGHQLNVLFRIQNQIWLSDGLSQYRPVSVPQMDQGIFRLIERITRRIQSALPLPYLNFFESLRFAFACRENLAGVDLLYERTSWMGYGGAIASRWTGIPLLLEDNGDHLDDLEAKGIAPHGLQRRVSLWLMGWAVKQARYVISSGQGWRQRFIERWRYPADQTIVIENGTDLVRTLKREDLKCFRTPDGDENPLVVVYLGGFYPWHGVSILLKAFAHAHQQSANLILLLIGAGSGQADAQNLAQQLGIQTVVTFAGHQSQGAYSQLLANADVGTSPYCGWPEYSGLKIFDYKAAGLPTIASGVSGNPTSIRQGETGWIVPPCDENSLYHTLLEVSVDRNRIRLMGQKARLEAESLHSWQQTVQNLESTFSQVLNRSATQTKMIARKSG